MTKSEEIREIVAIIIAYNPDKSVLQSQLNAIKNQVNKITVVNNSDDGALLQDWSVCEQEYCNIIQMGGNQGIAKAINYGLMNAIDDGYKYAILFDQDSLPNKTMVSDLLKSFLILENKNIKVCCVGPVYTTPDGKMRYPFPSIKGMRLIWGDCSNDRYIKSEYLITSGCLIKLDKLYAIGYMREDLFIDYVDVEWGLRASREGYYSFGVCDAEMEHEIGDKYISIFGKRVTVHSATRHYYMYRNAVALYKDGTLPLKWKIIDAYRMMFRLSVYILFINDRLLHIRMIIKGIYHGLAGNMGKIRD